MNIGTGFGNKKIIINTQERIPSIKPSQKGLAFYYKQLFKSISSRSLEQALNPLIIVALRLISGSY